MLFFIYFLSIIALKRRGKRMKEFVDPFLYNLPHLDLHGYDRTGAMAMVKMFIEQDKRLGTSGHPDRNNGGNGATWVLIK